MWLEHLLLLSMLQHQIGTWSWGRYVVASSRQQFRLRGRLRQYRKLLVDQSTFASVTLEELLDAEALPKPTTAALRRRYLPG
jgi:hypothetical protein